MQQPSDPFGIRSGSRFVVSRAQDVQIDRRRISTIAKQITSGHTSVDPASWATDHLGDIQLDDEQLANFVLVLDALNFYFWGEPRWKVSYGGRTENGYWALTLALRRALQEGYPLTDAEYLAQISSADVASILRGESVIPEFAARVHHLRESGEALLREHEGSFLDCIHRSNRSAPDLLRRVIALFPSFIDVRLYDGRTIPFYKRAQILISDLAGAFQSRGKTQFDDLTFLTAFADYKVPQVLHQLGVLRYSAELERTLVDQEIIPSGDRREVEIRAATITAVEEIALEASNSSGSPVADYAVDWHLWALGQTEMANRLPYHRTPTVAY